MCVPRLLLATPLLLVIISMADASRILVVFSIPTKSHIKMCEGISIALAEAGHEVTMVTPLEYHNPKLPNLVPVVLTGMSEKHEQDLDTLELHDLKESPLFTISVIVHDSVHSSADTLFHPNMRKLLDTGSFDLVIAENFATEAVFGLGQHFGAPVIAVSTFGPSQWTNNLVGNTAPLSYVPHAFSTYSSRMTMLERMGNLLLETIEKLYLNAFHFSQQRFIYDKAFPNTNISFDQAIANVSLVFQNTHFSINGPRPFVPNMIEIGGVHIDRAIQPLPTDIKVFLDSATDGVIYFSFGSMIRSASMKPEMRSIFTRVFASLKEKVIWKFDDAIHNLPSNVLIRNWFPQNDIFAHPNMKLFISHGGLLSSLEAIYAGVPVLGVPFYGDQRRNIEGFAQAGWALRLDYDNVTVESLRWALNEMLTNKDFSNTAKRVSTHYRDQPMTPREATVYWSEYVIRHRGAFHLRSAAMDLNFIQYHNLDIFMLLLATSVMVTVVIAYIFRFVCRRFTLIRPSWDAKRKKHI